MMLICVSIALLKLSEETDLDILNGAMESLVETYQTELLPVAAELTARLVRYFSTRISSFAYRNILIVRDVRSPGQGEPEC